MEKIKLVKIINERTSMDSKVELGKFTLVMENSDTWKDNLIHPILNSSLLLKNDHFFIERIHQDIIKRCFIFYEYTDLSYYKVEADLEKLKKKYISKGWKWKEVKK